MKDHVGKFVYGAKFFERYKPFFSACRSLPKWANVWIIGANDGELADPARHCWQPGWRGTFVEPQPDIAESLAERVGADNVITAALSDEPGALRLWRMRPDLARAYVRVGAHGSALTSFDRSHIVERVRLNLAASAAGLTDEQVVEPIEVPCITPTELLHRRGRPDLIQIDVEGMEPRIVPGLLALGAKVVMWEIQHLTDRDELADTARGLGYTVTAMANDMMAVC